MISRGQPRTALLLCLLLAPAATEAWGQIAPVIVLGAGTGHRAPTDAATALIVRPAIDSRLLFLDVSMSGDLAGFDEGRWAGGLAGRASWSAALRPGLDARLGLEGERGWYAGGDGSGALVGSAALELRGARSRAWVRAGAGRAGGAGAWRPLQVGELGARLDMGDLSVSLSGRATRFESLLRARAPLERPPIDTVAPNLAPAGKPVAAELRHRGYADARVDLRWRGGPLAIELELGGRVADRGLADETWVRVAGSFAVGSGLSTIVQAGRRPSVPEQGLNARPARLFGVRLAAPAPDVRGPGAVPSLEVETAGRDRRLLRLRVPDAERVELIGDFTDWTPIDLRRREDHTWEVSLRIPPGTHRVNLRIDDGPWIVPPGLPALGDGFGGAVGLLILE